MHSRIRHSKIGKAVFGALSAAAAIAMAVPASAGEFHFPGFRDGSQAYNSGVIAGAGPNWYSTFIRGERCEYRYRTVVTQGGPQKLRYQVCY